MNLGPRPNTLASENKICSRTIDRPNMKHNPNTETLRMNITKRAMPKQPQYQLKFKVLGSIRLIKFYWLFYTRMHGRNENGYVCVCVCVSDMAAYMPTCGVSDQKNYFLIGTWTRHGCSPLSTQLTIKKINN